MSNAIIFDIFDGLLPVMFVLGDNILQLIGQASNFSTLAITCGKLLFTILMLIYVSYLYFGKGESKRSSDNVIDIIMFSIIIIILIITITIIIIKIKKQNVDDENKIKQNIDENINMDGI